MMESGKIGNSMEGECIGKMEKKKLENGIWEVERSGYCDINSS